MERSVQENHRVASPTFGKKNLTSKISKYKFDSDLYSFIDLWEIILTGNSPVWAEEERYHVTQYLSEKKKVYNSKLQFFSLEDYESFI